MILRPYQKESISALWDWYRTNPQGAPLIVAPTGSGKSCIVAHICKTILDKRPDYHTLIVSHRKEIISQNAKKLQELMPNTRIGIYSAGLKEKHLQKVTFANIQSVSRIAGKLPEIQLLIIDECFTGKTLIDTPSGKKRIDQMRLGDIVYNAIGTGCVTAISKRKPFGIYKIKLSNGKEIETTDNHPFLSESGWITPKEMGKGTRIIGLQNMRELWSGDSAMGKKGASSKRKIVQRTKVLLNILLKEARERDVGAGSKRKNAKNFDANRAQAIASWWERHGPYSVASNDVGNVRGRLATGIGDSYGSKQSSKNLPDLLQGRFRELNKKNSSGNRREFSLREKTSHRSQERRFLDFVRVESIQVQKSRREENVYNLEIDGHPSYFAEGCLVHNCHLVPNRSDSMYQKFIEQLRNKNRYLKILGLTATPYRLDQGSLISDSSLFTDIAYDISVTELIEQGFLSPLISRPSKCKVDLSDLKTVGFDYDQEQMQEKFDEVVVEHCKEIISAGHDRKSWLIFCSGVTHAIHTSECLNEMGIKADYIHGDLINLERDRKINDFKAGKIKALCNCDILTTGFDYPALEMIALLRATKSVALYVQICGRGMRIFTGKSNCLILDFGSNIIRHGPIDCIHVKAKGKKGKKAEIKKMPVKECPACGAVQSIRVLECSCGYQFPLATTKLSAIPDTAAILSEPEILDVTWHAYKVHNKPGKPPSFKIEYGSGSRVFYDFLCFEHGGFASDMARKKWMRLCNTPPPATTIDAVRKSSELPKPGQIKVKKEGEYWRVLDVIPDLTPEFDSVKEIGINI